MALFIGVMSGTSLDGVDAVLAELSEPLSQPVSGSARSGSSGALCPARGLAFTHLPFSAPLHTELLALNRQGADELHRAAEAANAVAALYAEAAQQVMQMAGVEAAQVVALGAHGQTVRHRPQAFSAGGYTVQLLNGALLAELSGIDVICDLRSRDVAAGGQGAPLVPAFHAACFAHRDADVAVLNLGGMANLTLLPAQGEVRGFDCGPANVLMDLWCRRKTGQPFDADGAWGATGRVDAQLLAAALQEPFFTLPPPKSTGRDLFDADWLDGLLAGAGALREQDVMATLVELTARAACDALRLHAPTVSRLLVCGGGAYNRHLMGRLAALLGSAVSVASTDSSGIEPERVECLAFAWLAHRFVSRKAGNLPSVTGARGPRVLGALYPAC
ncbi:MAG: anhydro-N-acetylmuramic acid kinase [Chitinophagaceae bacterium]|nr:anhydro-N-acetylmuramic acid kinase [Rubrivivax sp.]